MWISSCYHNIFSLHMITMVIFYIVSDNIVITFWLCICIHVSVRPIPVHARQLCFLIICGYRKCYYKVNIGSIYPSELMFTNLRWNRTSSTLPFLNDISRIAPQLVLIIKSLNLERPVHNNRDRRVLPTSARTGM